LTKGNPLSKFAQKEMISKGPILMSTKPKLTLYIGQGCRFCQRVTDYLAQHPMEIEIKDAWADEAINQEMVSLTGSTQVPCLRMDDSFMHESLDIIDKLAFLQKS